MVEIYLAAVLMYCSLTRWPYKKSAGYDTVFSFMVSGFGNCAACVPSVRFRSGYLWKRFAVPSVLVNLITLEIVLVRIGFA